MAWVERIEKSMCERQISKLMYRYASKEQKVTSEEVCPLWQNLYSKTISTKVMDNERKTYIQPNLNTAYAKYALYKVLQKLCITTDNNLENINSEQKN